MVPLTVPKNTVFAAGVDPNPVPVMVTTVLTGPVAGVNEVIFWPDTEPMIDKQNAARRESFGKLFFMLKVWVSGRTRNNLQAGSDLKLNVGKILTSSL